VLHTKPHAVPSQVGVALTGAVQGTHEVPHEAVLLLARQAPLHTWKPALQSKPQLPPRHAAVAFGGAAHTLPQVPQLVTSVPRSWQPPAQKVVGGLQMLAQLPPEHDVPAGHTLPHAPQCELLVVTGVSQPFSALPSQLPQPASHAPSPHVPPAHAAVPCAGAGHALPQLPQCNRLVLWLVSQPLPASPSQLP
jgi:hypothetical protein